MNLTKNHWITLLLVAILAAGGVFLMVASPSPQPSEQPVSEQSEPTDKAPAAPSTDYGGMLLKMIVSVALVCLLAYAILRWGLSRLVGGDQTTGQMEVLGRLAIAPNRSILVVRVGPRYLVVGSGETGISILSELSEQEAVNYFQPQLTDE